VIGAVEITVVASLRRKIGDVLSDRLLRHRPLLETGSTSAVISSSTQ
jgi:hypothetical protein